MCRAYGVGKLCRVCRYRFAIAAVCGVLTVAGVMLAFPKFQQIQTFVVGIIGFGGVAWSISHSAKLSRDQHARQVAHERETLRIALLAELTRNKVTISENVETLKYEEDSARILVPITPITSVYEKLLDKIGVLSEEQARAVMDAYLLLQDAPRRLKLIAESVPDLGNMGGEHILASARSVRKLHEAILVRLEPAITALETN